MRTIISLMHVSLDGFVAGPKGELNWVKVDEELFSFIKNRIQASDTALYGRKTYEMMESYWPKAGESPDASQHDRDHSSWYNKAHKVVLSRTLKEESLPNTTIIGDNLVERIRELKQEGEGEILFFGSPTATHALMEHNLLDGYWLFMNPLLLKEGKPLFANIQERTNLELLSTKQFSSGVTELNYRVILK